MKNKKIIIFLIALIIIFSIIFLLIFFLNKKEPVNNNLNEIIPSEEISDEQLRNTILLLFFIDKETGEIKPESRLIDAKNLIEKPYEKILELWIQGPNNNKLKNNCSKNTKINNIELNEDCLIIDLSNEFIDEYNGSEDEKIKMINCLVNTLTELNEINSVKILINGENNKYLGNNNLSDKYIKIDNNK